MTNASTGAPRKIRLVISPNSKRNVKRPIIFALREGVSGRAVLDSLMKSASKKLCYKAKRLFTRDGAPLDEKSIISYLDEVGDGATVIVTRKKGESVPVSPSSSPAMKPSAVPPPVLRRRESHEDNLRQYLSPVFEHNLGKAVVNIITAYAKNCQCFDSNLPGNSARLFPSIHHGPYTTVMRVSPQRKKWREKSHKITALGYGLIQGTITQLTFRIDRMQGEGARLAVGVVDPRYYKQRSGSQYGVGDCSNSWGLGCDGMFRHKGKVIKLMDAQGRTPSWKEGQDVGISINPMAGKLAFFVGRKQYRVNPRSVNLPSVLAVGVSLNNTGDQVTFMEWTEQPSMQYSPFHLSFHKDTDDIPELQI